MEILKRGISLIALLLLSRGALYAQMHKEDLPVRDTLPAAVKTAVREKEESLPGTFRTDMKSLQGKVLSPVGENDPVKFAMTRPGVSGGAEGFSAFFARGGNLGNNLFTLDGVRIYGFSHLLGLTTSVPSEAVSSIIAMRELQPLSAVSAVNKAASRHPILRSVRLTIRVRTYRLPLRFRIRFWGLRSRLLLSRKKLLSGSRDAGHLSRWNISC